MASFFVLSTCHGTPDRDGGAPKMLPFLHHRHPSRHWAVREYSRPHPCWAPEQEAVSGVKASATQFMGAPGSSQTLWDP